MHSQCYVGWSTTWVEKNDYWVDYHEIVYTFKIELHLVFLPKLPFVQYFGALQTYN